jgi:hypothetical protein
MISVIKKSAMISSLLIFFCIILIRCDISDNGNDTDKASGIIEILSVTPSTGMTDNTLTHFIVNISYSLDNSPQGEIGVGFNNGTDIDDYHMIISADHIITEGDGTYSFEIDATTKNWGASGDFSVLVIISEYPHGTPWVTLGEDSQVLTF